MSQEKAALHPHETPDNDDGNLNTMESFYHEPENFKIPEKMDADDTTEEQLDEDTSKQRRRVTISEDVDMVEYDKRTSKTEYKCITNPNYKGARRSRYSMFISGIDQFDPYQELTAMQIAAFRQVFDMVDKDGGGSIDADELYNSMKDLESNLSLDEIKEILSELDRDGNGEIDFEEFLYMMTSMSIQVKEAQAEEQMMAQARDRRRQSIFFSVITKFAMKHSLKEIERYYASKTRYTPHVVGHYAAGARVDGLTDKELRKTWQEFSLANKGKDSPYAQPLNFVIATNNGENYKKKTIKCRKEKGSRCSPTPTVTSVDGNGRRSSECGQRRTSTDHGRRSSVDYSSRAVSARSQRSNSRSASARSKSPSGNSRPESRTGWTPRHRLPITHRGLPVVSYDRKKKLTIEDMSKIREKVNSARMKYYNRLVTEKETNAMEYWQALKVDDIPSTRLQNNFKKVFRAYSPTNEYESALNQLNIHFKPKPILPWRPKKKNHIPVASYNTTVRAI